MPVAAEARSRIGQCLVSKRRGGGAHRSTKSCVSHTMAVLSSFRETRGRPFLRCSSFLGTNPQAVVSQTSAVRHPVPAPFRGTCGLLSFDATLLRHLTPSSSNVAVAFRPSCLLQGVSGFFPSLVASVFSVSEFPPSLAFAIILYQVLLTREASVFC